MEDDVKGDRIVVLGDRLMCLGFRLAGVNDGYEVDPAEGGERIEKLIEEPDVGIIIADQRIREHIDWKVAKKIEQIAKPVVVFIPSKEDVKKPPKETLREMIKKALGLEIMR
jgi:vacuolar-type H+-ATPase subunit F/Vma7